MHVTNLNVWCSNNASGTLLDAENKTQSSRGPVPTPKCVIGQAWPTPWRGSPGREPAPRSLGPGDASRAGRSVRSPSGEAETLLRQRRGEGREVLGGWRGGLRGAGGDGVAREQWGARSRRPPKPRGGILALSQIQQGAIKMLWAGIRPDLICFLEVSLRRGKWDERRASRRHGDQLGECWRAPGEGRSIHTAAFRLPPSAFQPPCRAKGFHVHILKYFLWHSWFHLFSPVSNFNYVLNPLVLCLLVCLLKYILCNEVGKEERGFLRSSIPSFQYIYFEIHSCEVPVPGSTWFERVATQQTLCVCLPLSALYPC